MVLSKQHPVELKFALDTVLSWTRKRSLVYVPVMQCYVSISTPRFVHVDTKLIADWNEVSGEFDNFRFVRPKESP